MRTVRRAIPVTVSLAVVCSITLGLWCLKTAGDGLHHPVFFYLLPISLLAILYGARPALLCACASAACAAFFLYDPVYSFYFTNPLEIGDLAFFILLAVIGVKCTGELLRRPASAPAPKSRYRGI